MLLQPLFTAPIRSQTYLYPGYDDHASDVWRVQTDEEDVIVRRSRITDYPANPFHTGIWNLFGVDPRRVADLQPLNAQLAAISPIPIPQVLRTGTIDGVDYAVLECMPGERLRSFTGDARMEGLGEALARIHSLRMDACGNPAGTFRYPLAEFPKRLAGTFRAFATGDAGPLASLELMCEAALSLRPPEWGALILPDMDASQFLTDGERITALVDTEFYAVGPRELDFVALEFVLDEAAAAALARGYERILPIPDLAAVRPIYRYLYRLMEIQGRVPLDEWMSRPTRF